MKMSRGSKKKKKKTNVARFRKSSSNRGSKKHRENGLEISNGKMSASLLLSFLVSAVRFDQEEGRTCHGQAESGVRRRGRGRAGRHAGDAANVGRGGDGRLSRGGHVEPGRVAAGGDQHEHGRHVAHAGVLRRHGGPGGEEPRPSLAALCLLFVFLTLLLYFRHRYS